MDLHYKQEITVGALVLGAIALFVVGALWLGGKSVGSSDNTATIQFSGVGNLKEGVPVLISGVNKGKVDQIRLVERGKVLVIVSLDDDVDPRLDAQAKIIAISALGDAAVDFSPGTSPEKLPPNATIQGSTEPALTERMAALGDRADSVLLGAQQIVNKRTADELYATLTALQGTLKAAERTMRVFGNPNQGPTAQLTKTLGTLEQLSTRLDSTLANPALARTLNRTDTLTGNLASMTAQLTSTGARLDTLLLNMNQGRGTLGKFTTDTGLYTDIRQLSQSMKELLDELKKHPGKIPVTVKLF